MKNQLYIFLEILMVFFSISCGKIDIGETHFASDGLLSISLIIGNESQEFNPVVRGPYKDGAEIEFKIPSSLEDPVDLSKVKLIVSLNNDCFVEPKLHGFIDLTSPFNLKVRTATGTIQSYVVKATPILPIATFKKKWFKNGNDLNLTWPVWISSIAISKDKFVLYDGVENYGNSYIKVYDQEDANIIKEIQSPKPWVSQVKTDNEGNIFVACQNVQAQGISNEGFLLYYYDDINNSPQKLITYSKDNGCPHVLGNRFDIVGNINNGKLYVYALCGNTWFAAMGKEYYSWEFNDGVLRDERPKIVDFSKNINGFWETANIQRMTTNENSDIYLSYFQYSSDDTQQLLGSHIYCFNEDLKNITEMNRKNFDYKLLGFRVFEVNSYSFLAILTQAFDSNVVRLKVFNITDKSKWSTLEPGSDNYNEFCIFESEPYVVNNVNQWGDIAVKVDGSKAYIFATIVSSEKSQSGVVKYEMSCYSDKN